MKKFVSIVKVLFLVLLIIFVPTKPLAAEDIALSLAEKFFRSGNYYEAITEYKRFLCFNPNDERLSDIHFKIGIAYSKQGLWEDAVTALRNSINLATDGKKRDTRTIDLGILLIAKQDYRAAEFELLRLSIFSQYPELRRIASFYLGICHLYTFKFEEARKAFNQYFNNSSHELDLLLTPTNYPKYKSPRLAKWLSTFIPGLGQIYGGKIFDGLNALILNLTMGYLVATSLWKHNYQDAIIPYLSLFLRYYQGNRDNAERFAKEYNEELNRKYSKKILNFIYKHFHPLQP